MTDSDRMETALEISPLTVLTRGVLEWACPHSFFEELFERHCRPRRWSRKLTISAIAWLMLGVVTGTRRSVFAALVADNASDEPTIVASASALYSKYGRIEPAYTTAIVRESAARMRKLLEDAGARGPSGWEGYRVTILDGTDIAGTDHRLKPLRKIKAAGLPGRYVVAYDLATGLVIDAAASEDAYTSERELVRGLLESASPDQVFVADRFFCTTAILFAIMDRRAHCVIREHSSVRRHDMAELKEVGRVDTGVVSEHEVELEDTTTGERRRMRRIVLALDTPTEDGDAEMSLLTDLEGACPLRICALYRDRWTIERHFALVKTILRGEVQGLGRPRAALFAMGLAFVAANALVVVKHALRLTHGEEEFERLSEYYMADEVVGHYRAVDKLMEASGWSEVEELSAPAFWSWCRSVGSRVRTVGLRKRPRGPRRPQPPRASGKERHHYSTYRLLNGEDT